MMTNEPNISSRRDRNACAHTDFQQSCLPGDVMQGLAAKGRAISKSSTATIARSEYCLIPAAEKQVARIKDGQLEKLTWCCCSGVSGSA